MKKNVSTFLTLAGRPVKSGQVPGNPREIVFSDNLYITQVRKCCCQYMQFLNASCFFVHLWLFPFDNYCSFLYKVER
jgi:hypothetical protein